MNFDLVIVDDSALWLSVAEKLANLHPNVNEVFTFDDAMDAWVFLQVNKSTVLMTDIEMPWMNGLSFLSMFSEKLHVISTSTKMSYKLHATELGSVDFLSKPFSKSAFNSALTAVHQRISPKRNIANRYLSPPNNK